MDLYNAIPEIYKRKWSFINTFSVQINFSQKIDEIIGWSKKIGNDAIINVKDVTTPQLSASPIESYVCDEWKMAEGRIELPSFNIVFKDQDQMMLYTMFATAFVAQQKMYFNDYKCTVTIFKDADYYGEKQKKFIELRDCKISAISSLSISQETEAQIAEFSVDFKSRKPIFF